MYIVLCLFFFNDTATTEIYTLSLHDALPISAPALRSCARRDDQPLFRHAGARGGAADRLLPGGRGRPELRRALDQRRSEEHTSELQSRQYLVCRLLLEKKNN